MKFTFTDVVEQFFWFRNIVAESHSSEKVDDVGAILEQILCGVGMRTLDGLADIYNVAHLIIVEDVVF